MNENTFLEYNASKQRPADFDPSGLEFTREFHREQYSGSYTVKEICQKLASLRFQAERIDCLSYCIRRVGRVDCSPITQFLRTEDEFAYFRILTQSFQK